jgi:hypothetical protein
MTWTSFHRRGDVLRDVIAAADQRRDGTLPRDVDGVSATFADDLDLLGALQLKWHTRLAGRIEREQMHEPMDLPAAVVRAWQQTAADLPGIRAVIDAHRAHPADEATAEIMRKSAAKEHILLAVMAGQASAHDARAAGVGARLEERARTAAEPEDERGRFGARATERPTLLGRLKAALAA